MGAALILNYPDYESALRLTDGGDVIKIDVLTGEPLREANPKDVKFIKRKDFAYREIWPDSSTYNNRLYLYKDGRGWSYGCITPNMRLLLQKREDEEKPETDSLREIESLSEILSDDRYRDTIRERVAKRFPPAFGENERKRKLTEFSRFAQDFGRKPMNGQLEAILQTAYSMERNRGTNLVGEMGTGKTTMAVMAARLAKVKSALVICPPHLVDKWRREILATIPAAEVAEVYVVDRIKPPPKTSRRRAQTDIQTIERRLSERRSEPKLEERPLYAILANTKASLGYSGSSGATQSRFYRDDEDQTYRREIVNGEATETTKPSLKKFMMDGKPVKTNVCPDCFAPCADPLGMPIPEKTYWTKRLKCLKCGGALWQASRSSQRDQKEAKSQIEEELAQRRAKHPAYWQSAQSARYYGEPRYALGEYIAKRLKRRFDLLIADEAHEFKSVSSARGIVAGNLARSAKRSLTLTGTIMGGYSSNLFHLLYRFSGSLDKEFSHDDQRKWIRLYGFEKKTQKKADERNYNSQSRGYTSTSVKETPGLSPAALPYILANTSFIRLTDVSNDLPDYNEEIRLVSLDEEPGPNRQVSQAAAYRKFSQELSEGIAQSVARGSQKLLSRYLHSLMSWPDLPTVAQEVYDEDGYMIASAPALDAETLYPKEEELAKIVKAEAEEGRKTLIYLSYTQKRDTAPRIEAALKTLGLKARVVTANASERERQIAKWVKEGIDALIVNPLKVQTGLDLTDFPTICWYQPTYSTYTIRQASRRSWRIGQTEPVKVIHLIYEDAFQADALSLIAHKARASMAVEGELAEDGLSAYGDAAEDVHFALAKKVMAQTKSLAAPDAQAIETELQKLFEKENENSLPIGGASQSEEKASIENTLPKSQDKAGLDQTPLEIDERNQKVQISPKSKVRNGSGKVPPKRENGNQSALSDSDRQLLRELVALTPKSSGRPRPAVSLFEIALSEEKTLELAIKQ